MARLEATAPRKPFIPSKECAQLIGVTPEHLSAMRARGEGPPWSGEGKWIRYERRAVLDWLANLPRQTIEGDEGAHSRDLRLAVMSPTPATENSKPANLVALLRRPPGGRNDHPQRMDRFARWKPFYPSAVSPRLARQGRAATRDRNGLCQRLAGRVP